MQAGSPLITIDDIRAKQNELAQKHLDPGTMIREFLSWIGTVADRLDPVAEKMTDEMFDKMFREAEENALKMTDSPAKRKAVRLARRGLQGYPTSRNLIAALESTPKSSEPITADWTNLVLRFHQVILEFLFDVLHVRAQGDYAIVAIVLFNNCVDEMTTALHLAKRHFYTQANAHLRTILETLDRIELFSENPESVNIWATGDWQKIQEELSPSKVRQKLNRPKYDPLYGFLCKHGTHPTFEMFRNRVGLLVDTARPTAHVFISGTPFEHVMYFHYLLHLVIISMTVTSITKRFSNLLNHDEIIEEINSLMKDFGDFHKNHFVPWATKNSLDSDEMSELFDRFFNEDSK